MVGPMKNKHIYTSTIIIGATGMKANRFIGAYSIVQ